MYPSIATAEKSVRNSTLRPNLASAAGEVIRWRGLYGSAKGLALATAAGSYDGALLLLARDSASLRHWEEELRFYDPSLQVLIFPDWECLPYDVFSPHADIVSQRLATLYQLPTLRRAIVLATVATALQRLPPSEFVGAHSFMMNVGDQIDREALISRLVQNSYQSVSQVMEPGEFAVRGGLIDLFPVGSPVPFRIDLFDDQVESIREFDPQNQRSGRKLDDVRLLPAREFPMHEAAIQGFRQRFRARFEGDPQQATIYREVSKGLVPAGVDYYLPLFFERTATLFDYLPSAAVCILDDGLENTARAFMREAETRYAERCGDRSRPLLTPRELFLEVDGLMKSCARLPRVVVVGLEQDEAPAGGDDKTVSFDSQPLPAPAVDHRAAAPYGALIEFLQGYPGRVLIVAETLGRRETLRGMLGDHGFAPSNCASWGEFIAGDTRLALGVGALERGIHLPDPSVTVIAESQLYGERAVQRRRRGAPARDPEIIIRSLAELGVGDPVVHEEHGVGRYLGLQTLDIDYGPNEFLALEYAGGDKLYIPVLSLHLISRYTGTDPEHAPLHKLGSDAWERAKKRALAKAYDAAAELLEVSALRAARAGSAYPVEAESYQAFCDAFPFEETPDQLKASEEVLQDMRRGKPMDRLVCGDVGFGKTEVAMRAAFVAVHAGAQVALLVPTTLLAQQHYQNFIDRFAGLPFRIALLSRFRGKAEQQQILAELASGAIDVVIGTHRLLQDDMRFSRLGLVIIDEEHRFGVRQKERLKQLRSEVDVLTLTATPIPRTLNLALAGMRDISIIATAPEGRLAVKTLVAERDSALIREACLRELRRGGQVYYLHNEVRTIERAAEELTRIVPEAAIRVAHGQLPERELERIMYDFYHQRFNVLVCSTIIESGIDVPTANTIVIERADKLGLAQLHQLRGRVGRSHARAYAYLLIPGKGAITEEARKRLEAIAGLEELGAGFTLASHDLEIRGAGELLGEAQSGEIDEVGFTLYSELLARAVQSIKAGLPREQALPRPNTTEVNLHTPALLPEHYVPDVHLRLVLYKRIASAPDDLALRELREEIIDRFGLLPQPAEILFEATALKLRASALGIAKIDTGAQGARVDFVEQPRIDPKALIAMIQSAPRHYRMEGSKRLRMRFEMPEPGDRLKALRALLDRLTPAA